MLRGVLAVLVVLSLAGCAGDPAATPVGDNALPPGDAALPILDGLLPVAAPQWQVGQWWEWEVSFGTTTRDETFCSIVLAADGSAYTIVTELDGMSKDEAAFGVPFLGSIGKSDLAMDGWGGQAWSVLSFPLTDGKTWSASMPNIAWDIVPSDTVPLAMSAAFDPDIGGGGGFRLLGVVEDQTLLEAEYDPGTGWFASLRFYDVDPGEEGLEIGLRAKSTGLNYTGPYFQHTGQPLLQFDQRVGFNDVPTEGGQPYTQAPQPHWTFTMGEGTTLYGFLAAESVAGGRAIVLIDPANGQRAVASTDQPEGEQFLPIDEPGQAGEWKVETVGAGGFSGAFAQLYELTLASGTLPAVA